MSGQGRAADVIYFDFCKTFGTFPHNFLAAKADSYGF